MRPLLITGFLLFITLNLFSQLTVQIKDADTKLALPFATAECMQKQWGTYSDTAGKLVIPEDIFRHCTVLFTYVGYDTLQSLLSINHNVMYLKKQVRELPDVVIKNCKEKKLVHLKVRDKHSFNSLGFNGNNQGFVWATFIDNLYKKRGVIKTISFGAIDFWRGHKMDAPARLHFYEWDSIKNSPGTEITNDVVELVPGKTGWITIDISSYKIHTPAEGFVVGFEMIESGQEYYFSSIVKLIDGSKEEMQHYGWSVEARKGNVIGFRKNPGKGWSKKGELAPAVGVTMEVCMD